MESQGKPQTKEFKKITNPHTKLNLKVQGKKASNHQSSNQNADNAKQIVKNKYKIYHVFN